MGPHIFLTRGSSLDLRHFFRQTGQVGPGFSGRERDEAFSHSATTPALADNNFAAFAPKLNPRRGRFCGPFACLVRA
jgi:hypothetical protein